ncbi:hypothetical protein G3T36_02445 [Diaminobutyricibacter tongyongensis]|uniref:Uncharacterized protein n=1 Tax=Leifsonia tongyongensis TaxID=1268043 RepID=A0A6L9XTJ2_9MICO|nr:hypothetical protein [Diaminobutyricibacter tongyongensis]NEN04720.1 hypothetical protein [Diaminobutyricibacter tongyongensis]
MSAVPEGYKLRRSVNRRILGSDDYQHWTVADLIEILAEYPQDARVWVMTKHPRIYPIEVISADADDVFLS